MSRLRARLAGIATRRLPVAALAFAGLLVAVSDAMTRPAAPPNIVFIMTDDLDEQVLASALEGGWLPNIQAEIVGKGTKFSNSFVSSSICCPSRTTYLTGQYPHNHGVYGNVGKHGGFENFGADDHTLATWLHAAGYHTGVMGKYLNGYGSTPKSEKGRYVAPGWDTWDALFSVAQYDYDMSMNGQRVHYGHTVADYQTDVLSGLARDFLLHAPAGQPFFLTVTPTAPHYEGRDGGNAVDDDNDDGHDSEGGMIRPPRRYLDTPPLLRLPDEDWPSFNEADMSDKPTWMQKLPLVDPVEQRTGYNSKIAAMRAVDDLVGNVIAALTQTGQLANTFIVFTADNGFQYGTHRLTQKTVHYEESIRVPLYMRAPGQVQPRTAEAWAMNIDWAPTVLDYAGTTGDITMDGLSLRAWVEGSAAPGRRTLLVEHPRTGAPMTRFLPFAMVRSSDPALTGDPTGRKVMSYAETYDGAGDLTDRELYDFAADPYQDRSLIPRTVGHAPALPGALAVRLGQLKTCAGDACRSLQQ